MVNYYMIRDRNTGLFLKPGYIDHWKKKGRIWSNVAFLRRSMDRCKPIPTNWEIVEFQILEVSTKSVAQEIKDFKEKKEWKIQQKKQRIN